MALTSVALKITFNVVNHTFKITDVTDYVAQGVLSMTGYTGALHVTDPLGNIYAPTITPGISTDSTNVTPVLDTNGDFVLGNYIVTYTVANVSIPVSVASTVTFDFEYVSPEVEVSMEFDETLPLLTSHDNTNYVVNSITPTITRTHSIVFPPGIIVNGAPIADYSVSTALLETSSNLYTNAEGGYQYTGKVSSVLTYTVSSTFIILDTVVGAEYINVVSSGTLCDVYCAIKSLWLQYKNALCESKAKSDVALEKLYKVTMLASLIRQAMLCSKASDVTDYYNQILTITGSVGGCGCGDEPVLITGLGGVAASGDGITYVVVNSDGALTITPVTVGTTTTYTVNLSSTNLAKLAALRNVTLTAGAGISLDTSTDGDGNITYVINNVSQAVTNSYVAFDIIIDNTSEDSIPTLTVDNLVRSGTDFTTNPTLAWKALIYTGNFTSGTWANTASPTDAQFRNNSIKLEISDIFNADPTPVSPKIFTSVKRAYVNGSNYTNTTPFGSFTNSVTLNNINKFLTVDSFYNIDDDYDLISLGFSWHENSYYDPIFNGNIFYKNNSTITDLGTNPQLYTVLSVLIIL